jgi:hypothetical protein
MVVAKPVKLGVTSIEYEEVTDPVELAEMQRQDAQFKLNSDWLKEHASDVYSKYRGKYICIAGQEVFAADVPEDAWVMAEAAHPNDEGVFSMYLPARRTLHSHAHQR